MKYTVVVNQEIKKANISFTEATLYAKQQVASGNKVTVRRSQDSDAQAVIEDILNNTVHLQSPDQRCLSSGTLSGQLGDKTMKITRIDFATTSEIVVVNKIDDTGARAIVVESKQYPIKQLEWMLQWCEANGYVIRRFAPLGARAWLGATPRMVRNRSEIMKKRRELEMYPVDGLQLNAVNLALDC
jgi:hypothetical protein